MAEIRISNSPAVQPEKRMNLLQRVTGVILSPGAVMEDLAEKPRLIFPLILVAVSMLFFHLARFQLYTEYMRQSLISSQSFTQSLSGIAMTPEYIEQSLSITMKWEYLMTPLGSLFGWLLSTVIFFAVFKIFGAKGKFKQYLSFSGYAYVINALYLLVALGASFFTGSLHIDLPLTSLATLLPADMSGGFVYGIAKGLDIFGIWYYCVVAIGLSGVSGFRKRNTYILVGAIFAAGLIITGSAELARGAMMGG